MAICPKATKSFESRESLPNPTQWEECFFSKKVEPFIDHLLETREVEESGCLIIYEDELPRSRRMREPILKYLVLKTYKAVGWHAWRDCSLVNDRYYYGFSSSCFKNN